MNHCSFAVSDLVHDTGHFVHSDKCSINQTNVHSITFLFFFWRDLAFCHVASFPACPVMLEPSQTVLRLSWKKCKVDKMERQFENAGHGAREPTSRLVFAADVASVAERLQRGKDVVVVDLAGAVRLISAGDLSHLNVTWRQNVANDVLMMSSVATRHIVVILWHFSWKTF